MSLNQPCLLITAINYDNYSPEFAKPSARLELMMMLPYDATREQIEDYILQLLDSYKNATPLHLVSADQLNDLMLDAEGNPAIVEHDILQGEAYRIKRKKDASGITYSLDLAEPTSPRAIPRSSPTFETELSTASGLHL